MDGVRLFPLAKILSIILVVGLLEAVVFYCLGYTDGSLEQKILMMKVIGLSSIFVGIISFLIWFVFEIVEYIKSNRLNS